MSAFQVPCPKCGAVLKLRDRAMLGRTGKCPKCGHRFLLTDPDEVELELATEPHTAAPHTAAPHTAATPAVEMPMAVVAARRVSDASAPVVPTEPAPSGFPAFGEGSAFEGAVAPGSAVKQLRQRKRKQNQAKKLQIVLGGVMALVIGGIAWAAFDYQRRHPSAPPPQAPVAQRDVIYEAKRTDLEQMTALIAAAAPTQGTPITLNYVPAGAAIVIHLHPAALWQSGSLAEEVRYGLGPLGEWAGREIERYCLFPPEKVEEATFAIILGSRGMPPAVAAVARLGSGVKRSDLITRFSKNVANFEGQQVFLGEERALMFGKEADALGPTLLATAPAGMAGEMADAAKYGGLTSDAIKQILEQTDRQRHLSVVFQPTDLRIHAETLLPAPLQPALDAALDLAGDAAEAVCWSVHLTDKDFDSELLVRSEPTQTPKQVLQGVRSRLDGVPVELVSAVGKMEPAEIGRRRLIGRFPAMMQVFAAATVGGIDDRLAVLQTRLPAVAGPNLAVAGLLTWDQSTRTDFTKAPVGTPPTTPTAPVATLAQRLQKPIEFDVNRMPLEDVFAYIGDATGIAFEIDGEGLKLAGYTRNMAQTFKLGSVPASKAIAAIQAQKDYEKLAIVLDEANNTGLVTSVAAAKDRNLTPATFAP